MKIEYRLRGINPQAVTRRPFDRHLKRLDGLIPISLAQVLLEHQQDTGTPFCASVELEVPGPDIHVAARDHTLDAAVLKVARQLEDQIGERKKRQQLRLKSGQQCRRVQSACKR